MMLSWEWQFSLSGWLGCFSAADFAKNSTASCQTVGSTPVSESSQFAAPSNLRQLEQIFRKREHRSIDSLDLRICRLDHVVFIRRMCAAPVAQPEMAGRQF